MNTRGYRENVDRLYMQITGCHDFVQIVDLFDEVIKLVDNVKNRHCRELIP
jgi:hypothetical protein